ncbi:hypothetical protein [Streptomyces bacillaris]|uniref:hypothetical protein n=1 Tax=Streptomyces bacillaris TaxID=68179 RepID=UPI0013A68C5B
MFQDVAGASMFLRWQSDTVKKQIVPESAFTPPADFEVYPVALSVAQNGERLQATFKDRVGNHGKVKDHLKIEVDTSPMPVKAVRRASDNPGHWSSTSPPPSSRASGSRSSTTARAD